MLIRAGMIGLLAFAWTNAVWAQQPQRPADPAAIYWSGDGLSLEMAPLPIDPATAFFLAQGFSYKQALAVAQNGCIFRSAIGHSDKEPDAPAVYVDLSRWSLELKGTTRGYRTKKEWLDRFKENGVPENARIAFQWATFPTRQTFQAQDYNWGIHAFELAPGTLFDLTVVWKYGDVDKIKTLKNLKCPEQGKSSDKS